MIISRKENVFFQVKRVVSGESARRTSRHMGPIIITSYTTQTFALSPLSSPLCPIPHHLFPHKEKLVNKFSTLCFFPCFVMEGGLVLLGGGGGSSGVSTNESASDACSYPNETELELGLGLSLGCATGKSTKASTTSSWGECGRILTAKDFPSSVAVSGTKRTAESVSHETGSPTGVSQVVGWPPIRAYRMNNLVNQSKAQRSDGGEKDKPKDGLKKSKQINSTSTTVNEKGHLGFVKVNMDGIPIGRKVDLSVHFCYQSLAQALEDMFLRSVNSAGSKKEQLTMASKLLDGSSEFVLTYEDKEADWMLVGDVPWRMFVSSVRRLRIMRTSEANGLAPRFNERQRSKPI